jgi:hypothetical protein
MQKEREKSAACLKGIVSRDFVVFNKKIRHENEILKASEPAPYM